MADNVKESTWSAFLEFIEQYSKEEDSFVFVAFRGDEENFDLPSVAEDKLIVFSDDEPNAVLKASGIALSGRKPWIAGSAAHFVGRCYPQIREALAIPSLPVRIAVYDGGLCVGHEAASSHMTEDIALMRSMPNMSVLAPSDRNSLFGAARVAAKLYGPAYLRLGQSEVSPLDAALGADFTAGGARIIKEGSDVTICTCGIMTHEALKASVILEQQGISAEIVECYSIKPFPETYVLASVRSTGCCVVAEEHSRVGGLCGAVAECLSETYPVPVRYVAVEDHFVGSGTPGELREYYGLTWKEVANAASQAWALRRR